MRSAFHRKAPIVTGFLCAAIGAAVIFGWFLRAASLIQIRSTFAPMQFNAALAFVLIGSGLVLTSIRRHRFPLIGGILVFAFSVLTLLEYGLKTDFGIDQLLIRTRVNTEFRYPGRVPPNASLCFLLCGSALIIAGSRIRTRWRPISLALIGSVTLAIGIVAVFGYVAGMKAAYTWGRLTPMALHSAIGFLLAGAGIVGLAWGESVVPGGTLLPRWLPIPIAVGVGAVTLCLWQALLAQQSTHVEQMVHLTALSVKGDVAAEMAARVLSLVRMAKHWVNWDKPDRNEWNRDADLYSRELPGLQYIGWVDPSFHMRWMASVKGSHEVEDIDIAIDEQRRQALVKARDDRDVRIMRSLNLAQGGKGIMIYIPIFQEADFGGFILGVFDVEELFGTILKGYQAQGYEFEIFDDAELIYSNAASARRNTQTNSGEEIQVGSYGIAWRVTVAPDSELLARTRSYIPETALVLGVLMAFFLSWLVVMTQGVQSRTSQLESFNLELQRQVTRRKQTEEALRESEQRFRLLAENSTDLISRHALDGTFLYSSPASRELLGYEPEELYASSTYDFVHPEDFDIVRSFYAELIEVSVSAAVPPTHTISCRMRRQDGEYIWLETTCHVTRDPVTNSVVEVQAASREVTERKRAEEALKESEERFRGAFDFAPIGIALVSPDGRWLRANRALSDMLGFSEEELLESSYQAHSHPDDLDIQETHANLMLNGELETFQMEKRYLHREGKTVWTLQSMSLLRDQAGEPLYFILQVQDITERKRAEEDLKAFAEKLERSNRELQDFASVASHDLQEPLRKVQAFGDRLKQECNEALSDRGKDYLDRMLNAVRRMQNLINDLLSFSRLTLKAQPFTPVDLAEVTKEVVLTDLDAVIEKTGGRVEIGTMPILDADPLQMRQLMQNLISNGLKFHRGEIVPVIRVFSSVITERRRPWSTNGNELCQLFVEDNGIGFDNKYLDRIFAPFQRLHAKNEYEGTGMGLALCRKIVERHNGNITAKSTPGQGATFIVTLPVKQTKGDEYK